MALRQRLDEVVDRFNILEQRMAAGPAAEEFVRLSREYAELEPLVRSVSALREAEHELAGIDEMLRSGDELAELAEAERPSILERIEALSDEIREVYSFHIRPEITGCGVIVLEATPAE